jgi:hypothetical protein
MCACVDAGMSGRRDMERDCRVGLRPPRNDFRFDGQILRFTPFDIAPFDELWAGFAQGRQDRQDR